MKSVKSRVWISLGSSLGSSVRCRVWRSVGSSVEDRV